MQILASCSLEEASRFNGKLLLPNEDAKKPDKVFLNIIADGRESVDVFKKVDEIPSVKCITFVGEGVSYVPTRYEGSVFVEKTLQEALSESYGYPSGVVVLVRLPKDFPNGIYNMRTVYELSIKNPNMRFIGGNILGIEGIRVGRFDSGKEKMSLVFSDIYDTFVEVDLGDLSGIQEIVKKTRRRAEHIIKEKKSKAPKEKKVSRRVQAFNSLFGDASEVEF